MHTPSIPPTETLSPGAWQTQAERLRAAVATEMHAASDDLTIILMSAELAIEMLPADHPVRGVLVDLQRAATHCAWVANRLRAMPEAKLR